MCLGRCDVEHLSCPDSFPLPLQTGLDCGNNSCSVSIFIWGKRNAADMSGNRRDVGRATSENRVGSDTRVRWMCGVKEGGSKERVGQREGPVKPWPLCCLVKSFYPAALSQGSARRSPFYDSWSSFKDPRRKTH